MADACVGRRTAPPRRYPGDIVGILGRRLGPPLQASPWAASADAFDFAGQFDPGKVGRNWAILGPPEPRSDLTRRLGPHPPTGQATP